MEKETLIEKQNVVAVGDGYKTSKNPIKQLRNKLFKLLGKESVIVFVNWKVPSSALMEKDKIPSKINGKLTDVVEVGDIEPCFRKKHRPIKGGVSACNYKGTACTSGIKVYKENEPYALMNWHCVYGNRGKEGDDIVQPSRFDGGKKTDVIGYANDFIPLDKGICDSALVDLEKPMSEIIHEMGSYETEIKPPRIGQLLQKFGRTTGHTKGKVIAVNVVARVNYPQPDGGKKTFTFKNQIFTENSFNSGFIDGGDSSSIAFEGKYPVGQIFAASSKVGVITPLQTVLNELGVSLEGEIEGYVALDRKWLTDEKTIVRLNLRNEPKIGNNIIKTLSVGRGIEIIKYSGFANGYHWVKIKI